MAASDSAHAVNHCFPIRRSSDLSCNEVLVVQNHPSVATTLSDDATPTPNTAAGGDRQRRPLNSTHNDNAIAATPLQITRDTISFGYHLDCGCCHCAGDRNPTRRP